MALITSPIQEFRKSAAFAESNLISRGWKRTVNPLGEIELTSPSGDWQFLISKDGWMSFAKFNDDDVCVEDVGMVATPRWCSIMDSDDFQELEAEMRIIGVFPWACSHCGEEGGKPVERSWSEFQGVEGHGGVVHFSEEGCTRCL
jgi:hypothetical protein